MDLNGSQKFNAPPQKVWDTLMNPAVLKECIPGADSVAINGNQVQLAVNVPIPGVGGAISITAVIAEQTPPSHAKLTVDRSGSIGTIKGEIDIDLAADGAGTNLTYKAHFDLGGAAGMFGNNPLGHQAVKSGLNKFFSNLETKV